MIDIKEYPYVVKHSEEGGCNKDAFYMRRKLINGEILYAEDIIYLNGVMPRNGDKAICGSCGKVIYVLMDEHVVLREVND